MFDSNPKRPRKRSNRALAFDRFTVGTLGATLLVTAVLGTLWLLEAAAPLWR